MTGYTLRALAFQALRQRHHLNTYALGVALTLAVVGTIAPGLAPALSALTFLAPVGVVVLLGTVAWWFAWHVMPAQSTAAQVKRDHERAQRTNGVADWIDIAELAGPRALARKAPFLRPTLAASLTAKELKRIPPEQLGTLIATLGTGRLPGQQVWSTCEDMTATVGAPRTGKTLALARKVVSAPGALITTSTRLDLAEWVHAARCHKPVHVINLAGLRDVTSTVRWSITAGCENFTIASERATILIPDLGSVKDVDWQTKARIHLSLLLHAAAIGGHRAADLLDWITADNVDHRHCEHVSGLLARTGPGAAQRVAAYRGHFAQSDNSRKSVITTMEPGLAFLSDDTARHLGDAAPDDPQLLDIERLILRGETLHIIGAETAAVTVPLIAALVAEVARVALHLAGKQPTGRLDPQVTILLDEAAVICPVPLAQWTSWFGGANINMHVALQSIAQMRNRWGKDAADQILGNIATFVMFGGSKSADDLAQISALTGDYRMRVVGDDHDKDSKTDGERRGEHKWRSVVGTADASAFRPGQVLVLQRGLRPVVGYAPLITHLKGWDRIPLPGDLRCEPDTGDVDTPVDARPSLRDRLTAPLARFTPSAIGTRLAARTARTEKPAEAAR